MLILWLDKSYNQSSCSHRVCGNGRTVVVLLTFYSRFVRSIKDNVLVALAVLVVITRSDDLVKYFKFELFLLALYFILPTAQM